MSSDEDYEEEEDDKSSSLSSNEEEDNESDQLLGGEDRKPSAKRRRRYELPRDERFVEWDRLIETRWGTDRFNKYLPVFQIDELVGWATHLSSSSYSPSLLLSDPYSSHNQEQPPPQQEHNPLLGLPNVPMRPTLLRDLIQIPAYEILNSSTNEKENLDLYMQRFDQSAAVAISMMLEEMITLTLLPMAQLHVQRCRQLEASIPDFSNELLDDDVDKNVSSKTATKDSFRGSEQDPGQLRPDQPSSISEHQRQRQEVWDMWTLPADEAILSLITSGIQPDPSNDLPPSHWLTACAPTHTLIPLETSAFSSQTQLTQKARETWCQSQQLDPEFVQQNMEDLFKYFVPNGC
jgi:hypothetical protein